MLCSQRGPLLRALGFAAFRAKRGKKEGLLTADSQIYADFLSNTQRSLFCPPIPPITLKNSVALRGDFIGQI